MSVLPPDRRRHEPRHVSRVVPPRVVVEAHRLKCRDPPELPATGNVAVATLVSGAATVGMGLHAGSNGLGPGPRANVTVGRALRLALMNIGGAIPGLLDVSCIGWPGKLSFCAAEHTAASPWPPFHSDREFAADATVVTVAAAYGFEAVKLAAHGIHFGWRAGHDAPPLKFSAFKLGDPRDIPPRDWIYKPVHIRKYLTLTTARGGTGKSSLVLAEAVAMATGLVARLDNHAGLTAALQTAKLTSREYSKFAITLVAAHMAHGFIKAGVLPRVPDGAPTHNVEFVDTHQAEVTAVLAELGMRD